MPTSGSEDEPAAEAGGAPGAAGEGDEAESDSKQGEEHGAASTRGKGEEREGDVLTEAQRSRVQEQRQRALERRAARCSKLAEAAARTVATAAPPGVRDTGGGFLLEEEPEPPTLAPQPPAPVAAPLERPRCELCGTRFAASFLWDTFGERACDACHDPDGAHALVARGAALAEFLLRPGDVDARPPALRALQRRNPHAPRTTMRLYLRAQLQTRAELVWGGAAALAEERARREGARGARAAAARGRRLAALRRSVRPGSVRAAHEHRWGPERHDAADDVYSRACLDCPHVETYEKM